MSINRWGLSVMLCLAFHTSWAQVPETDSSLETTHDSLTLHFNTHRYSTQNFEQQKAKLLLADAAFHYRNKLEWEGQKPQTPPKRDAWTRVLEWVFTFFNSAMGQAILWVILVVLFLFIVMKVLQSGSLSLFYKRPKKSALQEELPLENPEDLNSADWESKMMAALHAQDHRAAVRYSYLWLLQQLWHRGLIQYLPEKTNTDYYYELSGKGYGQDFKRISRTYEYTWYGHYPLDNTIAQAHLASVRSFQSKAV